MNRDIVVDAAGAVSACESCEHFILWDGVFDQCRHSTVVAWNVGYPPRTKWARGAGAPCGPMAKLREEKH